MTLEKQKQNKKKLIKWNKIEMLELYKIKTKS